MVLMVKVLRYAHKLWYNNPNMDDPDLRQPGNHLMSDGQLEELRLTTDIILQAAELVQELECGTPQEASRAYFINDTLGNDRLRVPPTIEALVDGRPDEMLVVFDAEYGLDRESINIKLMYDRIVATISRGAHMPATESFVVELASIEENSHTLTEVDPIEVSYLIASLLYPNNSPELAQFSDPNHPGIAAEIQDVLRETIADSHAALLTYVAEDGVTEIISMDDGEKITDIEVISSLADDVYFSVERGVPIYDVRKLVAKMALDPTEKRISFFLQHGVNGTSEEFIPDRSDLEKLRDILLRNQPPHPVEVHLEEE